MDISAFYLDERNAITQPDKMVFVSQYFRRNWMGTLGPTGTAIVLYLRGACYHNRKSGETRDTVQLSQREIAEGCGCSVATLKRELEHNETLKHFVHISHEWERNIKTGRVRQLENIYKVAMDDPLTEQDEKRLKIMVEERINREQKDQEKSALYGKVKKRIRLSLTDATSNPSLHEGSNAVNTASSNAVNTASSNAVNTEGSKSSRHSYGNSEKISRSAIPAAQSELLRPAAHFAGGSAQNELLIQESLLKTTNSETLNVEEHFNFVASSERSETDTAASHATRPRNLRKAMLDTITTALVNELGDLGSERRHHQLLDICERNGLDELPKQALLATRRRLAQEQEQGILQRPGAYYQKILVGLLEDHQVFVPPAGSKEEQMQVRQAVRDSLGMSLSQD